MSTSTPTATVHALKPNTAAYFVAEAGEAGDTFRPTQAAAGYWGDGVLSGPAIDRLKNARIERVVLTNTIPLTSDKQIDKIEVLSIAPLIADALNAVFDDTSVSEIFGGENQA